MVMPSAEMGKIGGETTLILTVVCICRAVITVGFLLPLSCVESHILLSCFTLLFCWNMHSTSILRKGEEEVYFLSSRKSENVFILRLNLIENLGRYRSLCCKLSSLQILKVLVCNIGTP